MESGNKVTAINGNMAKEQEFDENILMGYIVVFMIHRIGVDEEVVMKG